MRERTQVRAVAAAHAPSHTSHAIVGAPQRSTAEMAEELVQRSTERDDARAQLVRVRLPQRRCAMRADPPLALCQAAVQEKLQRLSLQHAALQQDTEQARAAFAAQVDGLQAELAAARERLLEMTKAEEAGQGAAEELALWQAMWSTLQQRVRGALASAAQRFDPLPPRPRSPRFWPPPRPCLPSSSRG